MKQQPPILNIYLSFLVILTVISPCILTQHAANGKEHRTASNLRILFLAPSKLAGSNAEEIQLNTLEESIFSPTRFRKGWHIEANKPHKFTMLFMSTKYDAQRQSSGTASTTIVRNYRQTPSNRTLVKVFYVFFTTDPFRCDDYAYHAHLPIIVHENLSGSHPPNRIYRVEMDITLRHEPHASYHICLKQEYSATNNLTSDFARFKHQGTQASLTFSTFENVLPLWFKMVLYTILVLLYSIFNGLNLGLMALSVDELKLYVKVSESPKERQYARHILPLRKKGNFLLCSILLSIAFTSSVSTLILEDVVKGFVAGIISTIVLCLIGEILPQAICSKYSLPIGSYTRRFTQFFIYLTSVFSYPLSKIVDYFLGKEVPMKFNRDAIKELIKKGKDLHEKQFRIIAGALDFKNKNVSNIMTPLDRVFMLQEDERLNFETIVNIYNTGFSRLPVYQGQDREAIVGWIHIKDLTLVHPDDELPVKTLVSIFKHHLAFCYDTDSLTDMFEIFRLGSTHLAFVLHRVQNDDIDPYDKCVGIVTLHDVLEALVQFDIYDELTHRGGRSTYGISYLRKIIENHKRKSLLVARITAFDEENETTEIKKNPKITIGNQLATDFVPSISSQTKLVIFQILGTIEAFKEHFIDKVILEKMINDESNIVYKCRFPTSLSNGPIHVTESEKSLPSFSTNFIYTLGKPCDYFILIIEGAMVVEAGQEKTECYTKQFDYFGVQALLGNCKTVEQVLDNNPPYQPYAPEYSLRIDYENRSLFSSPPPSTANSGKMLEMIAYLKIDRKYWLKAVKATHFKRQQGDKSKSNIDLQLLF